MLHLTYLRQRKNFMIKINNLLKKLLEGKVTNVDENGI